MGRPSKLTAEVQERIVTAISTGLMDNKTAAQAAGIAESTLYLWMDKGSAPDAEPLYSEFLEALESARAEAETELLAIIHEAATGRQAKTIKTVEAVRIDKDGVAHDVIERSETTTTTYSWQAAAWILERSRPHKYARAARDEPVSGVSDADDAAYRDRLSSAGQSLAARLAEMKSQTADN